MKLSHETLLTLLEESSSNRINSNFYNLKENEEGYLDPLKMANLYINSALLVTIMGFLKEQLWLKNEEDKKLNKKTSYEDFLTPFFLNELAPVSFLKKFLIDSGSEKINQIKRSSKDIESQVLSLIIERSNSDQKIFAIKSLDEMTKKFIHEEKNQEGRAQSLGHKGLCLYRTFDNLDDLFDLNYELDKEMVVDYSAKERLYERAGVGVQSGYSTILLALDRLEAKEGSTIIDLGSGYGRVGLVCSLLRPDIKFIGYEYVPHRVEVANNASKALKLQQNLNFKVQDLSLKSFKIPEADIYYLYDPFTKETYVHVLNQLIAMSKNRVVTIVTKGNGRSWLIEISKENSWPDPIIIDEGNLCIFKSE